MSKNYYDILWIDKNANIDDIKKAYRRLAMKYHPDRNKWEKESEIKFKEINEAYSVLSDTSKRKQYDMFGSTWWSGGFGWWNWGFNVDIDLWDLFGDIFGMWGRDRSQRRQSYQRWEDIKITLDIDLKTSILWGKQILEYNKMSTCKLCKWEWWSWKKKCNTCGWSWYITRTSQSMFGMIQQTIPCNICWWAWETLDNICWECEGQKRIKEKVSINIDIPPGIDNEMIIRIEWEWNDGINTNAKWDLYIAFRVNLSEKLLRRKWENLYYDLDIDVVEAILGTEKEINIPIIWKRKIKIDSGTQFWSVIKLSGDWVPYLNSDKKWDLYINLNIIIPKKLSTKERECYESVAKDKKLSVLNKKWILEKLFG